MAVREEIPSVDPTSSFEQPAAMRATTSRCLAVRSAPGSRIALVMTSDSGPPRPREPFHGRCNSRCNRQKPAAKPSPRPSEPPIRAPSRRRIAWPTPNACWRIGTANVVTERPKLVLVLPQPRLELDDTPAVDTPARTVERRLGIVGVIDEPRDHLEVTLRLHGTTHHAERSQQVAPLEQHAGDDRVERPLRRGEHVRVVRALDEARGAVLEREAGAGRDDAGAEALVDALNQRDRGAVTVDGAQVRGTATRSVVRRRVDGRVGTQQRPKVAPASRGEEVLRQRAVVQRPRKRRRARASSPRSACAAPGSRPS